MARFVLMHLTPAARAAFRTYRDAHRACTKLGVKAHDAWLAAHATAYDIQRNTNDGRPVHPDMQARLKRQQEAHQRAETRWQATCEAATAATKIAVPLLAAEGYPFGWWHTGTMRLPQGVTSPGADRLRRR